LLGLAIPSAPLAASVTAKPALASAVRTATRIRDESFRQRELSRSSFCLLCSQMLRVSDTAVRQKPPARSRRARTAGVPGFVSAKLLVLVGCKSAPGPK
jgi:hypothetical protein